MYEAYFGFSTRPFSATPCADHYFPATVIEAARQSLERTARQATGVGLVVGASGVGKSMLAAVLADQLGDSSATVLLSCGRLATRRALLQAILHGLGQPYRGMDEGELRLAMIDHLRDGEQRGVTLLIDEGHSMSMRLLEELRLITNLAVDGRPLVRLLLFGSARLEERLASPRMEPFNQRLVARCYLEPLNQTETCEYILARISAAAGGESAESIISAEGCKAVFDATDGIPRLINQICDHALLWACCQGRKQVDTRTVEEAWADLQQLPTPWSDETNADLAGGGSSSVVEFGGLDDEEDETDLATSLRLAVDSDEATVEPVEQLDRVQEVLEDLDDEFQPAGSIHPEVELVFDDPADLLNESFEEEELIVDRYGRENRQAAQVVESKAAPPRADDPSCVEPVEPAEMNGIQMTSGFPQEAVSVEVASFGGSLEEKLFAQPPVEPVIDTSPQTVPLRAVHARQVDSVADPGDQLIVVEDTPAAIVDDSSSPVTAVRHQEFGQFFTRLRRTS